MGFIGLLVLCLPVLFFWLCCRQREEEKFQPAICLSDEKNDPIPRHSLSGFLEHIRSEPDAGSTVRPSQIEVEVEEEALTMEAITHLVEPAREADVALAINHYLEPPAVEASEIGNEPEAVPPNPNPLIPFKILANGKRVYAC